MSEPPTLTVIVPALNEEADLRDTVQTIVSMTPHHFVDWEVLLYDDGGTDRIRAIADELAADDPHLAAIHHERPRNLGGVYKAGLARARMNHVILINGKNDLTPKSLDAILSNCGRADMVVPFTANRQDRNRNRQVVSNRFVTLINRLFGLRLRYYNHSVLHQTALARSVTIDTDSYAFQAELLIKLLKRGHSYVEVGVVDRFPAVQHTRSFKAAKMLGVARFLWRTYWAVRRDKKAVGVQVGKGRR